MAGPPNVNFTPRAASTSSTLKKGEMVADNMGRLQNESSSNSVAGSGVNIRTAAIVLIFYSGGSGGSANAIQHAGNFIPQSDTPHNGIRVREIMGPASTEND